MNKNISNNKINKNKILDKRFIVMKFLFYCDYLDIKL